VPPFTVLPGERSFRRTTSFFERCFSSLHGFRKLSEFRARQFSGFKPLIDDPLAGLTAPPGAADGIVSNHLV